MKKSSKGRLGKLAPCSAARAAHLSAAWRPAACPASGGGQAACPSIIQQIKNDATPMRHPGESGFSKCKMDPPLPGDELRIKD